MKSSAALLLVLVLFSCQGKKQDKKQENRSSEIVSSFKEIDLGSNLKDSGEKMLLSDLVEDVEYIKLETTNASLLAPIYDIKVENDHLFINTYGGDNNAALIKVFERNGKFVRSVGAIGQGPGEYRQVRGYDVQDSLLLINSNWMSKILFYNWQTNRCVKEIPIERAFHHVSYLKGGKIALYPGPSYVPKSHKEKDFFSSVVISPDGKEEFVCLKHIADQDTACVDYYQIRNGYNCLFLFDNNPNCYDDVNDTIYRIKSTGIDPAYFINIGKYKMPICDYFMDEKFFYEGESYIQDMSFIETRSYLYMDFSCQRQKWIARYNKSDGTLKCWAQKGRTPERVKTAHIVWGGGFYNDVDGGPQPLWKTVDGGKYIVNIIWQGNWDEWSVDQLKKKDVKFPEKREKLIKLLEEFGEDDNPIIALYKLKQ